MYGVTVIDGFEVIGRRSRKVNAGDVFVWKLGHRAELVGQVLHDSAKTGFGPQLLVAFFDLPAAVYAPGQTRLDRSDLIDLPFITDSRGWLDGCFVRIDTARPSTLGDIGLDVGYLGQTTDLDGVQADRQKFDMVILGMFNSAGAVARRLSVVMNHLDDPINCPAPWELRRG